MIFCGYNFMIESRLTRGFRGNHKTDLEVNFLIMKKSGFVAALNNFSRASSELTLSIKSGYAQAPFRPLLGFVGISISPQLANTLPSKDCSVPDAR